MASSPDSPLASAPRRRDAMATRARLMEAGRRAFARKGLAASILTDDILRPAGVSTGSFYHQFRDKNELLLAILDEHAREFRVRLLRTLEDPVEAGHDGFVELARACYGMALDMAEDDGDLLRIQRRERDNDDPEVAGYLRENQDSWIDLVASYFAGGSDDDAADAAADDTSKGDCRLAAQFVIHLCLSSIAHYQDLPKAKRPQARERLLDALVRFTMGGLPALTRERQGNPEADHPNDDSNPSSAADKD